MRQEFVTDLRLAFVLVNARENNKSSDAAQSNTVKLGGIPTNGGQKKR
jgi:hypothetical protein